MGSRVEDRHVLRTLGKIEARLKKARFACLYPGCAHTAIRSHSQQKEGQLRAIATQGRVYAIDRSPYSAAKQPSGRSSLRVNKIGIAKAATFPGYCAEHDKELFAEIERSPLRPGSKRQALLLFLRSLSYEVAQKRKVALFYNALQQKLGRSEFFSALMEGTQAFVKREGDYYLQRLFRCFSDNDPSSLAVGWKVVPENLLVSCSCCINPLLDDYQTHFSLTRPQPLVSFNLIPTPKATHVVAVCLDEYFEQSRWLVESLNDDSRLEPLLNRLAFGESEDSCIGPFLWDRLPAATRERALYAMRHDLFRGPLEAVPDVIRLSSDKDRGSDFPPPDDTT